MGDPCGVPTSTRDLVPGAPWKTRVQVPSNRKEVTQSNMYKRIFFDKRRERACRR